MKARVVLWIGVAVCIALDGSPLPAWIGVLLCAMLAASEIVAHAGEKISNDTARIKAINEALKVSEDEATRLERTGDIEGALAVLEAGSKIGKLTDGGAS